MLIGDFALATSRLYARP